jgi:hypothetical protein
MKRQAWASAGLAAMALLVGACSEHADRNPNAPGSPGTGNATEVVKPAAPDGPPGGPSGIAGSAPHTGASGGDVVPGTTGKGSADAGGRSQPAQPGTGLNGGLGAQSGSTVLGSMPGSATATTGTSMGNAGAPSGSANSTSRDAVGRR